MTQYNEKQSLSREVRATAEMIARDLRVPMLKSTVRKSASLLSLGHTRSLLSPGLPPIIGEQVPNHYIPCSSSSSVRRR